MGGPRVLLGPSWEPGVTEVTMLVSPGLVSALLLPITVYGSPSKTPVTTCCPPGSFLAIEDSQESRQLPNGLWVQNFTFNSLYQHKRHHRYGRHNVISRVSCLPDKNNLQPINGFRGSLYPDPPYFSSVEDKLFGLETRSKPLSDNQILQSTGDRLPSCPGGPIELATIILGDGRANGFGNTSAREFRDYGTSARLRINEKGHLVGSHLDFFGSTNWLRLGMKLPRRFKQNQSLPVVEETELGVDFCLTWSTDPRTKLVPYDPTTRTTGRRATMPTTSTPNYADMDDYSRRRAYEAHLDYLDNLKYDSEYYEEMRSAAEEEFIEKGPTHLLEAVYCDPCKSRVLCSSLITNFLPSLQGIFDPEFWAPEMARGPGLRGSGWWIALWPSYLDADRDGKGSIQEFYDVKVVQFLRIIFDGLDVNSDGLVKQNEARLDNFFRPVFLRNFAKEFFDYLDKNNDNQISVADITRCERDRGPPLCLHMNPLGNKTVDNCYLLNFPLDHVCTSLMTAYFSPDFDLIDAIQVTEQELLGTILRVFQFFAGKPGNTKVGLKEIVEGFARLGEPPQVVASLTQLLTPIVNTFPRMILRSLVKSADKNLDGSMDWKEFEGFGDFELVFTRWPKMWRLLQDNLFAGMNTCDREGERCFPAPWTTEDLKRYFSNKETITRLIQNFFFHQDFQFPAWNLKD